MRDHILEIEANARCLRDLSVLNFRNVVNRLIPSVGLGSKK